MASARRGTSGTKTPKASIKEQFPVRPPYVSTSDGKAVSAKRVIKRPDRTLSLKRIDANLE
jgi:hypothetical protein